MKVKTSAKVTIELTKNDARNLAIALDVIEPDMCGSDAVSIARSLSLLLKRTGNV